jgi:putative transposase
MLPGLAVHAIQRANNRGACFCSDEDRAFYLFHLARALPRARCRLHAYCLMTNHVHLLLTADDVGAVGC